MYKNDSLYQVLLKYDFDLFRGDKGNMKNCTINLNISDGERQYVYKETYN